MGNKEKTSSLPCGITQEQLDGWKSKFKEVFLISVELDGKTINGIFRKPGMKEFSKVLKFLSPDPSEALPKARINEDGTKEEASPMPRDLLKAGLIYYLDCKLAADPEMESDEEIKAGACIQLVQKFKAVQATIKNL